MNLKNYLWLAPFASFLIGYIAIQWMFYVHKIETPSLVGKNIGTVLPILSQLNLNVRILHEKEEDTLTQGTILYQTPSAGTAIKPHQSIFIVTTKKKPMCLAPECIGISADQITQLCNQQGISTQIYYLCHPYPQGICFAQSPQANETIEKHKLILYISSGNNKPVIWPNLAGRAVVEVVDFLELYHINPYIMYDGVKEAHDNSLMDYCVIDQRPLPGTLITMDDKKPISVQLRVSLGIKK